MNEEQLYVFAVCLFAGLLSGGIYDVIWLVKRLRPGRTLGIVLDAVFFVLFSLLYIAVAVWFGLPYFRLFMLLGCLVGLLVYLKSCHRMVAFFCKWLYNRRKARLCKGKKEAP